MLNKLRPWLLPAISALVIALAVLTLMPLRTAVEFNVDEGYNMMRAFLVAKGYALYGQVSSDQPPLFTYALVVLNRLSNNSLTVARLFTLLHSMLIGVCGTWYLQRKWGRLAAVLFMPMYLFLPFVFRLSASVMIGLPATAYAFTGLVLLLAWVDDQKAWQVVASALLLSVGIWVKIYVAMVAPVYAGVLLLGIFGRGKPAKLWPALKPAVLWAGVFAAANLVAFIALVGTHDVGMLIRPHLMGPTSMSFEWSMLDQAMRTTIVWFILAQALPALYFIYIKKDKTLLAFWGWFVVTVAVLGGYQPFWFHYMYLIMLPLAVIGAVTAAEGISVLADSARRKGVPLAMALVSCVLFGATLYNSTQYLIFLARIRGIIPPDDRIGLPVNAMADQAMLEDLRRFQDDIQWMISDEPIFAFLIGRPVPPYLATFSGKRFATGEITLQSLTQTIDEYKPEAILMGQLLNKEMAATFEKEYKTYSHHGTLTLFIRRDLIKKK